MAAGYGARMAQARRVLSVAMKKDVTQTVLGDLIGSGMGSVSRWESEEMRPRRKWLEAIARLAEEWGVPGIDEAWLDYGKGEGPPSFGRPPERPAPAAAEASIFPPAPAPKRKPSVKKQITAAKNPRKRKGA